MAWNPKNLKLRSGADREPPSSWKPKDLKLRSGADREGAPTRNRVILTG